MSDLSRLRSLHLNVARCLVVTPVSLFTRLLQADWHRFKVMCESEAFNGGRWEVCVCVCIIYWCVCGFTVKKNGPFPREIRYANGDKNAFRFDLHNLCSVCWIVTRCAEKDKV